MFSVLSEGLNFSVVASIDPNFEGVITIQIAAKSVQTASVGGVSSKNKASNILRMEFGMPFGVHNRESHFVQTRLSVEKTGWKCDSGSCVTLQGVVSSAGTCELSFCEQILVFKSKQRDFDVLVGFDCP